ncbi:carbohydrate ABC transporter permease [Paenibacillus nasutitermitis]|uniref:ABC transporter permease n=1 Tax=Paenibacillus nasutitermitis TaxID=1652958 RepID=A0A916ZI64_9BACL|nr:sugar ABC transporter permease [Paenibacillus nasutitermitis]GGD99279.1 ABC transporter permease [Paenibacillus nasutitermitis]
MERHTVGAGSRKASMSPITRRAGRRKWNRIWWSYLFVLPQFAFFIAFTIYPIIMSYVYSFFDWSGIGPLKDFAGWGNYIAVLHDKWFWNAFGNTFVYMLGTTCILMPTSLLMAIALNRVIRKGRVFYRVLYFLPVITTTAINGLVMKAIFGNKNAFFNELLIKLGILDQPFYWLGHAHSAMILLILIGSWQFFGMMMVYWLAGLQSLPTDVYEAASIDGSSSWQSFRHITVPLLLPIGAAILLLSTVHSMHVFDLAKTLTEGGPYFSTDVMDLYVYRYAFDTQGFPAYGRASAAGILFGISIFAMALLLGWLVKKTRAHTV